MLHLIVVLTLAESVYSTSEGATLSVCVILTRDLGRNVIASISTIEGTAQG